MTEIKMKISRTGDVDMEVGDSTIGADCEALTKVFEQELGVKVDSNLKPQFYQNLEEMEIKVTTND